MAVARFSRYRNSELFQDANGNLFLGLPEYIDLTPKKDDVVYIVNQGDTLFSIAFVVYSQLDKSNGGQIRAASLWDVVAIKNGIVNPMEPLVAGRRLRLPSFDEIHRVILSRGA